MKVLEVQFLAVSAELNHLVAGERRQTKRHAVDRFFDGNHAALRHELG
jgi:hypothetical protein